TVAGKAARDGDIGGQALTQSLDQLRSIDLKPFREDEYMREILAEQIRGETSADGGAVSGFEAMAGGDDAGVLECDRGGDDSFVANVCVADLACCGTADELRRWISLSKRADDVGRGEMLRRAEQQHELALAHFLRRMVAQPTFLARPLLLLDP